MAGAGKKKGIYNELRKKFDNYGYWVVTWVVMIDFMHSYSLVITQFLLPFLSILRSFSLNTLRTGILVHDQVSCRTLPI